MEITKEGLEKLATAKSAVKPTKYRSVKTWVDGICFDSKMEAGRYLDLQVLASMGVIRDLRLQVKYELTVNDHLIATYAADFVYIEAASGSEIVEDVKGKRTKEYILKRKLMLAIHGITISEYPPKRRKKSRRKASPAKGAGQAKKRSKAHV